MAGVGHPPYGQEKDNPNITQTCAPNYRFAGYEQDTETGLYYATARHYSPTLGRFMSQDPLGESALDSDSQTWNRYAYVRNTPTSLVDPFGLCTTPNVTLCAQTNYQVCPAGTSFQVIASTANGGQLGICANTLQNIGLINQEIQLYEQYTGQAPCSIGGCPGNPGSGGGSGGGSAANNGFTLGVRAPGQTWTQCMSANSGNYSIAGAFNLQGEGAKFALGNDVSQLLFGNTAEGTGGLALWEGGSSSFEAGVGSVMTAGRRTASIMDLNLAGTTGPAPMILGKTGAEQAAGWLSGLAEIKMAIDVGLTGAQAIGCAIHR